MPRSNQSDAALNSAQKVLNKENAFLHEILTPNAVTDYHDLSVITQQWASLTSSCPKIHIFLIILV